MNRRRIAFVLCLVAALSGCSGSSDMGTTTNKSSTGPKKIPTVNPPINPELPPALPRIDSFSPRTGNPGTSVTIVGFFDRVESVKFNDVEASSFTISDDAATLTAVAPVGLDTGAIVVANETGTAASESTFESWCNPTIDRGKSLIIKDLSVVNDPIRTAYVYANPLQGVWSFSYLMEQMKPELQTTSEFITNWLNQWSTVSSVNGFPVSTRTIEVLNAWPKLEDGALDLEKAPFRLLSITNRLDLRNGSTAGEARFIFNMLDSAGEPTQSTVIVEYKMPLQNGETQDSFLQAWHDLSLEAMPSEEYNLRLAELTNKVTLKNFTGIFINGSAIGQVRTNERLAENKPWEMREFRLDELGNLMQTTTFRNPDDSLNQTETLDQFMLDNQTAILAGNYVVPKTMLGGATQAVPTTQWLNLSTSVPEEVRHQFSLNTCSGCHSGETQTKFLQFSVRAQSEESVPSDFLLEDETRRYDDMKSLIVANLCKPEGTLLQSQSISSLSAASQVEKIVWVSKTDPSKKCESVDRKKTDFDSGRKKLSEKNIHVFGMQKNQNRSFWKEQHSCEDEGGYLQCYQIKTSDLSTAITLGFSESPDCSINPYTRVH